MRFLNMLLGWFRSTAKTVGLSPKALAPIIGAGLTALLAAVGVTPADIGGWIGVDGTVVAGGLTAVAASVAAWLLPPGNVVPLGVVGDSSDELLAAGLVYPGDQVPAAK